MRIKRTFVKNRMMEKVEDVLANTTCNLNKKLALTKKIHHFLGWIFCYIKNYFFLSLQNIEPFLEKVARSLVYHKLKYHARDVAKCLLAIHE